MTTGSPRVRVKGALNGSLLLEQPAHRAKVDAFLAFLDEPGPVNAEVGIDTGTVLIDQAHTFPEQRWVGFEIRRRNVERARPHAPPNALLWGVDARTVFANVVPAGRFQRVDVLFPTPAEDPTHRLFSAGFVEDVARALSPSGVLTVATDVDWLWAEIAPLLTGWTPTGSPPRSAARSRRERVGRRDGLPVFGGSFTPPGTRAVSEGRARSRG